MEQKVVQGKRQWRRPLTTPPHCETKKTDKKRSSSKRDGFRPHVGMRARLCTFHNDSVKLLCVCHSKKRPTCVLHTSSKAIPWVVVVGVVWRPIEFAHVDILLLLDVSFQVRIFLLFLRGIEQGPEAFGAKADRLRVLPFTNKHCCRCS